MTIDPEEQLSLEDVLEDVQDILLLLHQDYSKNPDAVLQRVGVHVLASLIRASARHVPEWESVYAHLEPSVTEDSIPLLDLRYLFTEIRAALRRKQRRLRNAKTQTSTESASGGSPQPGPYPKLQKSEPHHDDGSDPAHYRTELAPTTEPLGALW